jgi:PEP-CTERM motif
MKKMLWPIMAGALVAVPAIYAGPTFAACQTESLSYYETTYNPAGGCTIGGDFLFSGLTYTGVDAFTNPVTATNITVTPSMGVNGPTLLFSANWSASGVLSLAEGIITFSEDSQVPGIGVSGIDLTDTGTIVPGALGALGTAAVAEVDCYGGLLDAGTASVACLGGGIAASATATIPTGVNVSANALLSFADTVEHVDVIKTITLSSVLGGSSSIGSIEQDLDSGTVTPEPASFFLIGGGLIAIGVLRKKALALKRSIGAA